MGCEIWLKTTITNQEVVPLGYENHNVSADGVLVAFKSTYISSVVDIDFHSKLVAVQSEGVDVSPIAENHIEIILILK